MTSMRFPRGPAAMLAAAALALSGWAPEAGAQYFGRNKVQYETFDFRILKSEHFDLYFYPAESIATADAARMAERWYTRHSRTLSHTFTRKPLIFYADHPDFQQTNVIGGFISQGTGGVTESGRSRVVMPFTGVYADNDHVLGHELVHVFQYDMASGQEAGGPAGMNNLPLWVTEGMAEYLSVGRNDPLTAMWLRDAALRNDLPTLRQLSTDPRYFPYRFGQAFWAYVGGRWGDDVIKTLYRQALRQGWEPAIRTVLRVSPDTLSRQWLQAIRDTYLPVMQGRQAPGEVGARILRPTSKEGDMDVAPALSPDGKYVAFFTRRGLFDIDLYVADAQTGEIVKKLTGPNTDSHFDALSFINSAGSWSPDGRKLAFVVFYKGDNAIAIFDVASRRVEREIRVQSVGAINDPAWGPNNQIVFSGMMGGVSDLYLLDLGTEKVHRLTNDRYADIQPAWSPDGRTIAFASDRGEGTSFEQLAYSPMQIALYDVQSGQLSTPVPPFAGAKHINPQWSPDGRSLYFVSDREGFSDLYRYDLDARTMLQVTHLATGVSGITAISPAVSVAKQTGRIVFSVFDKAGYSLFRLEPDQAHGQPVLPEAPGTRAIAGVLPPVDARNSLVTAYLQDPLTGLPPQTVTLEQRPYKASLGLDYIGSPGVGGGVGPRGAVLYGGVAGYFGDMLADRVVGTTLQVAGSFLDTGGEVFYLNQRHRWNWLVSGSHIPYLQMFAQYTPATFSGGGGTTQGYIYSIIEQRIFVDQVAATVQYPFSQTRRLELGAGAAHQWYNLKADQFAIVGNQVVDERRTSLDAPPGITYGQATVALVGDRSYNGFTSPVAGARYRFEASPTFGQINFTAVNADYRRYFFARPVTFAFRALHYGRYGKDSEDNRLGLIYVGQPWLVRGYESGSFDVTECTQPQSTPTGTITCPEFDRLIGSRIGVANFELRIPLLGTQELGLIPTSFLPVELAPFVDAGVAWTKNDSPTLAFKRNTTDRVPVVSAGVSARFNLFGYMVIETYFAKPFQRPNAGWKFGFQLAPGW
ncbi:MAG TPA: BamA/TamA family outer membrane protein [Gemmatimonadaceae bacterium]|nr:BamA/TamA family outer membrane protein [Gemmatimonadaceae bacterium]